MTGPEDASLTASGLNFPSALAFDESGTLFVAESGLALGGAPAGGRVLRLDPDGGRTVLLDDLRQPVNGLTYHRGGLYVVEGGNPGRIGFLDLRTNAWRTVLDGLPGGGNYHTNSVAVGADGRLYFGQGSATNSGVVGPDSLLLSWLKKTDHPHDVPGVDVVLTGENAEIVDPSGELPTTITGAFQPFGTATRPGQRIEGRLPCTSAVMRCGPDGSNLELVAWGLRNPFGLAFTPGGRLLCIDLGMNDRGSRPIGQGPSFLFEIIEGAWYGWPDYAGGIPVSDPRFKPTRGPIARFLLSNHGELGEPARPLLSFEPREAPTRFAMISEDELIVTLFGDSAP